MLLHTLAFVTLCCFAWFCWDIERRTQLLEHEQAAQIKANGGKPTVAGTRVAKKFAAMQALAGDAAPEKDAA